MRSSATCRRPAVRHSRLPPQSKTAQGRDQLSLLLEKFPISYLNWICSSGDRQVASRQDTKCYCAIVPKELLIVNPANESTNSTLRPNWSARGRESSRRSATAIAGLEGGENCQQYANELVRAFEYTIPGLRSTYLWADTAHTAVPDANLIIGGQNGNRTTNYPLDFLRGVHTGWYVGDAEEAATQDGKAARS
jgi:hypothetical protein